MKFLIDAQLPKKLSEYLIAKGFDSVHTLDLPYKNKTKDSEINRISIEQGRIVMSKDTDFYNSYLQTAEPFKLIYLTTGNTSTKELLQLMENNLEIILHEIAYNSVIEVSNKSIITII